MARAAALPLILALLLGAKVPPIEDGDTIFYCGSVYIILSQASEASGDIAASQEYSKKCRTLAREAEKLFAQNDEGRLSAMNKMQEYADVVGDVIVESVPMFFAIVELCEDSWTENLAGTL